MRHRFAHRPFRFHDGCVSTAGQPRTLGLLNVQLVTP